jgi:signal transduction histidine kinase
MECTRSAGGKSGSAAAADSVSAALAAGERAELARLKDRFLSAASHELRTPLTNLCAFAEILRSMPPGEGVEWTEFVRVIHEETLRLKGLVDGIFDYLALLGGHAQLRDESVDPSAVVRQAVAVAAAAGSHRGIRVAAELADLPDGLRIDAGRLRQLCRELLENAVRFTPDRGQVRVATVVRDGVWTLLVDDSGRGVPEAERQAIFERFHQLADPLCERTPGTGLGLATCAAIVACYGGAIGCEASPLGGARFAVHLPVFKAPGSPGAEAIRSS